MKKFIITEKFVGYADIEIEAETEQEAIALYNIMCSQDEIVDYLNESDWFDTQTFDNLFDNICAAKETYLSNSVIGA